VHSKQQAAVGVSGAGRDAGLTVHWVGDIGLNGPFCDPQHHALLAESMAEVARGLGECDLRIGNWEAPLWGDGGVNLLKVPRLCTTREAAEHLLPLRLDVALLANNHVYDCLEQGFENTVRFLEDHGVVRLGAGRTPEEAARPLILTRAGLRIGLLNYVGPETHPSLPPDAGVFVNYFDKERVLQEVRTLSADLDLVVVHLHWGAVELIRYPTVEQRHFARQAVEAGATVVVGHHAHCLHGNERWGRGHIFYGLGNFLFGECGTAPGRAGEPWPKLSRQTAAAVCRLSTGQVQEARLCHLVQEDLVLRWDDTPARAGRQRRLCRGLRLPDKRYSRLWRREVFYQRVVARHWRLIAARGGLLGALLRLRWRHVATFIRGIAHPKGD
jgi:hypothetical protein